MDCEPILRKGSVLGAVTMEGHWSLEVKCQDVDGSRVDDFGIVRANTGYPVVNGYDVTVWVSMDGLVKSWVLLDARPFRKPHMLKAPAWTVSVSADFLVTRVGDGPYKVYALPFNRVHVRVHTGGDGDHCTTLVAESVKPRIPVGTTQQLLDRIRVAGFD